MAAMDLIHSLNKDNTYAEVQKTHIKNKCVTFFYILRVDRGRRHLKRCALNRYRK